ncbi:hypothetical protein BAUCODRAFT_38716 [Baudoinia panamericana UAMH 10762]|uniref:Ketoreductase (KR) domain-containing protein n=1 Tax=Baudoinia panamericana (strain UAMH 10762) TaxID=717646 RepID=M2MY66_BAUPA|nr:uncharacterized protein BAUCODRAFT_38716 [Baudoinia panamericana UAMH 10762]EMC91609.1 hypothetical protein BAUCODRAFT_38716 [Baudoinia panamericana UAMH 10762]
MAAGKRIVLITGANTGLGFEIVKALYASSHPYEILLGTRTLSNGEKARQTLHSEVSSSPGSSNVTVVQADVSSDSSLEQLVKDVESKHGRLDCLINNAGANFDQDIAKGTYSLREGMNKSWDVNITGTHILTTLAMPLLLKSDDPRLIFMTSGTSSLHETERLDGPMFGRLNAAPAKGWPKAQEVNPVTVYRSTKAGLNMLMRQWERILREDAVKIWAISPGFLVTGLGGLGEEALRKMGAKEPHVGGEFVRDVVEGKRDHDVGKIIRSDMIQPY